MQGIGSRNRLESLFRDVKRPKPKGRVLSKCSRSNQDGH